MIASFFSSDRGAVKSLDEKDLEFVLGM